MTTCALPISFTIRQLGYVGAVDDSVDTDNDGIKDCQDPCPYSASNNDPTDSDTDNVPDCMDQCPQNDEVWVSSSVCGCLSDQNADGVINILDCPVSSVSGCTDILACNYKSTATQDNGSCVYPTNCRECYNTVSGTSYLPNNTGALTDGSGILWQNMINAPVRMREWG